MTALEMMQRDEPYVVSDFDMPKDIQRKARRLCHQYNLLNVDEHEKKHQILEELFGTCSTNTFIEQGFKCDYGINIHTDGLCVMNFNVVILDTSPVRIGCNCFIAPNVVLTCVGHSLDAQERSEGIMTSKPITIEENVWIGSNVTICGGVTIHRNSVIGANSVVTRDIEEGVVAFGSPCKAIRKITEKDKLLLENSLKEI